MGVAFAKKELIKAFSGQKVVSDMLLRVERLEARPA